MKPFISKAVYSALAGAGLLWGVAAPAAAQSPVIPAAEALCDRLPNPARWLSAGAADAPLSAPLISAHRGGTTLAPENTLLAYEYALAYEVAMLEVDVRQTADRRFVAFHDSDLEGKTDGTGRLEDLSFDQARALNVADYEPWIGSVYDPAQMASLEEVLELARSVGGGIEFDMKFMIDSQPLADLPGFAAIVNRYPEVLERSIINLPPPVAQLARALIPQGRFIYNLLLEQESPAELYALSVLASVFGSSLEKFTPERIVAIHDGCGLVMPHSYDEGLEAEAQQILLAQSRGADGVQTNQPELARALLAGPVPAQLILAREPERLCLINARNGLGFPGKALRFETGTASRSIVTGLGGCAEIPAVTDSLSAQFEGDASVMPAQLQSAKSTSTARSRWGGSFDLWGLGLLVLIGGWRRPRRAEIRIARKAARGP